MNVQEMSLPLKINKANEEMTMAILNVQNKYDFPSYLMELIVSKCLVDLKTCAISELVNTIKSESEGEK